MDFFNDLTKKFSNVAKSVTEKTKDGVEATRLANDLRSARNTLTHLYTQMGMACYDLKIGAGSAELAEQLAEQIRAVREHIDEMTALRDALRDVKRCPACGFVVTKEARFCSSCGKRLPEEAPVPDDPASEEYCPDCGAQRINDEKYCAVCGKAFEPATEAEPAEPDPVPMPAEQIDVEEPAPVAEDAEA